MGEHNTPVPDMGTRAHRLVLNIPLGASTQQISAIMARALESVWSQGYTAGRVDVLADVTGY